MSIDKEKIKTLFEELSKNGETLGSSVLLESAESGNKIPASHLKKIQKWIRSEIDVERIHTFPVLMIDTTPTRNNVIYTEVSQKKSVKKWQGIPFLFNSTGVGNVGFLGQADHSLQASSQMGRLYDARMIKTPNGEVGTLGWFYTVSGVDETVDSFIQKLESGILREVSIHVCIPEAVVCSIDGKNFQSCREERTTETEKVICFEHYPGEKYGSKVCYMSTGESALIPLELSAVACPGSVSAHVMKDDEVENYSLVSLSEALGGSQSITEQIRGSVMANKKKVVMSTESSDPAMIEKIREAARLAGVTLSEKDCDEEDEEKKKKDKEEKGKADKEKADKEKKDKEDEEAAKLNSPALFEGACPACNRSEQASLSESESVAKLRKQYQEQALVIIEESKKKVQAAEAKAATFEERSKQFEEVFEVYVQETATLAVEQGHKKSYERDNYVKSLQELSFKAVREIREAFSSKNKPTEQQNQQNQENLKKLAEERYRERLGNQESQSATPAKSSKAKFAAKVI